MKLGELKQAEGSLNKLLEAKGIPADVAFKLVEFAIIAKAKLQSLETVRIAKIKELGETKDNQIQVKLENQEQFASEMDKVIDEDVVLPDIKVSVSDLKEAGLSVNDFTNLKFLIKGD